MLRNRWRSKVKNKLNIELVNHPIHYNQHPSGVECITIVEHMTFNIGSAIKYCWRAGLKGNEKAHITDLEKARWYLDREIERLSTNGIEG